MGNRLMRKARRNRVKVAQRNQSLKLLSKKPVIKKIDAEELKKQASAASPVAKAAREVKEEVKKAVEKVTGKAGEEKKTAKETKKAKE